MNSRKRLAFIVKVKPGHQQDYITRHSPIWPEMTEALKSHGVHNYSVFMDHESGMLFGNLEIEDSARWEAMLQSPLQSRWWNYLKDIMVTNADGTAFYKELKEVFRLD